MYKLLIRRLPNSINTSNIKIKQAKITLNKKTHKHQKLKLKEIAIIELKTRKSSYLFNKELEEFNLREKKTNERDNEKR